MIGFDIYPSVGGPGQTAAIVAGRRIIMYRRNVQGHVDRLTWKAMGRMGAYCRMVAKRMLSKFAKGPSRWGHPPHSHTGLLRNKLWWGRKHGGSEVVVGPEDLSHKGYPLGDTMYGNVTVPQLLEHGSGVVGPVRDRKGRTKIYKKRPYMSPAYNLTWDYRDKLWTQALNDVR